MLFIWFYDMISVSAFELNELKEFQGVDYGYSFLYPKNDQLDFHWIKEMRKLNSTWVQTFFSYNSNHLLLNLNQLLPFNLGKKTRKLGPLFGLFQQNPLIAYSIVHFITFFSYIQRAMPTYSNCWNKNQFISVGCQSRVEL